MGAWKGMAVCAGQTGRALQNEGKPVRSKVCTSKGVEDEVGEAGDRARDDEDQQSMARGKGASVDREREEAEGRGDGDGDEEAVGAEAEAEAWYRDRDGEVAGVAVEDGRVPAAEAGPEADGEGLGARTGAESNAGAGPEVEAATTTATASGWPTGAATRTPESAHRAECTASAASGSEH